MILKPKITLKRKNIDQDFSCTWHAKVFNKILLINPNSVHKEQESRTKYDLFQICKAESRTLI